MKLEEIINNIPDTFYNNLFGELHNGELHTRKSLNLSLREIDDILERKLNLRFPCSTMVREKNGEVYYSSVVRTKTYREHIVEVKLRMIECRKLILHKRVSKLELYDYLLNTLYLVYKDYSEVLEGMESEVYVRDSEKRSDIIEYFNNNKI